MSMENIDLHEIACFGFTIPKKDSWLNLLKTVQSSGWKSIDINLFEKSLASNVKTSYQNMVSFSFRDLDTDTDYLCGFDNKLKLWKLEIPDTPDDAIDENDKKTFFKNETFKNTCKRADRYLTEAYKACIELVMPEVEQGKFIELDEIKFDAILDMLDDPTFRKNLKLGKFVK